MKKIQTETQTGDAAKVTALVTKLNRCRHEYYNLAAPSVSDAVYDHLFDELQRLEKRTGIILSNSPTQTVGAAPVSSLNEYYPPWEPPVSFLRATPKWYFPSSKPQQHIVSAYI